MLKVDAHSHAGTGAANWTATQIVERMNSMGVDKTVIFPFTEGFFTNDYIFEAIEQYPNRLIPFCAINPWEKEKAYEELERCFKAGFMGVKLHPTMCGFRLSDKALVNPVFEIAEKYEKVVIAHGASDLNNL
jgi:hypothetical protein